MSIWGYLWAGSWITKWLYHLNGNSNDSSGSWNNWTDSNVSYVAGKFWQCGSFNGSSSKIVLPTISMNNITLSYWVKLTNLPSPYNRWWISCWWVDLHKWFELLLYTWISWETSACAEAYVRWWTTNCLNYNTTYTLNTWIRYNVMMTRDWNIIKTYIDWVLRATRTYSWAGNIDMWWYGINIGTRTSWNNFIRWVDWLIDEVIIENVARTAEQIKKYYTYTKWRFGIL